MEEPEALSEEPAVTTDAGAELQEEAPDSGHNAR